MILLNNIVVFGAAQSGKSTLLGYLASTYMSDKTFSIEAYEIVKRIRKQGISLKSELILPGFLSLDRDELIDDKKNDPPGTSKRVHRKKVHLEIDSSVFPNYFTFIDTPGFRAKKREQYGYMFEGDIGLCVVSAIDIHHYLSLGQSNQAKKSLDTCRLFAPLRFWSEFRGTDKLVVVLTKTDFFFDKLEVLEHIYISLSKLVREYSGYEVPIVPTSIQLKYNDHILSRLESNIRCRDEKLVWYEGNSLLDELKKKIATQKPPQKVPFQIAAVKQIRKIPNTSSLALRIQCVCGDLGKEDSLLLGPILNKEREQVFLQGTVKSLKIEDGEITDRLSEGVIGGIAFKALSTYGSKSANASLADYKLSPTTVLIRKQFFCGNTICLRIKKDELSKLANIAFSQLLPKEQLHFYWFGKKIVGDVIEFFDKKEYIYITLANLADISNGSEKKIALPNPENLAVLDLECLVELQYVEYCLKDDLERISQHTHALFHIVDIKNISCGNRFSIELIIHHFYDGQQSLDLYFPNMGKIDIFVKDDSTIAITAKDIHMGDLQEYYRYFRRYVACEGIYSYELRLIT